MIGCGSKPIASRGASLTPRCESEHTIGVQVFDRFENSAAAHKINHASAHFAAPLRRYVVIRDVRRRRAESIGALRGCVRDLLLLLILILILLLLPQSSLPFRAAFAKSDGTP